MQRHEFDIPISAAEQPDLLDVAGYYQRGAGVFPVDGGGYAFLSH